MSMSLERVVARGTARSLINGSSASELRDGDQPLQDF